MTKKFLTDVDTARDVTVHGWVWGTAGVDVSAGGVSMSGDAVIGGHAYCSTVPTNTNDLVNKLYVDNAIAGLAWKDAVLVATTANITLSGTQSIDGVAVGAGDRVLVKNQTTGSQNGIYVVAAGAWARSTDADANAEVEGMTVVVMAGTTQADTAWICTTNAPAVGSTALTFAQLGGGGGGSVTDVMWVGASAPSDASIEVWYDTDEPTPGPVRQPVVQSAATSYTLALTDENVLTVFTASTAIALTVPLNSSVAFPVGARIDIAQVGAGKITVAGAGGVTLIATPSAVLRAQGSVASLIKYGSSDSWILTGDLT